MHDHDGAGVSSPEGGGADPGPPRSEWGRQLKAGAALLLAGLLSLAGSASAVPSAPIGQWVSAGAAVDLGGRSSWLSDHEGAAVEVVCADTSRELKVRGYFGQGDDVLTGWTSAKNVRVVGWTPRTCGLFDW